MLKFFLKIFLFFLLTLNFANANNNFFECLEKISEVRLNNNKAYNKGVIYGTSYIKLIKNKNSNQDITIHFKIKNSKEKPSIVIKKKNTNNTSLGFTTNYIYSLDQSNSRVSYNFIEIGKTYVFNKNNFSWTSTDNNYDFETTARCNKINKHKYLSLLNNKSILKSEIIKKKVSKKKNTVTGQRTFALSWEGIDELIIGQVSFVEENLIGKINFILPHDESECIGSYVLLISKGTWSILCEKNNMNASGFLEWNNQTGTISGYGKDSKRKKVRFKISGTK